MLETLLGEVAQVGWKRRSELLCDFTQWWHGRLPPPDSNPERLAVGPDVLRSFHEQFARAPFMPGAQNEFLNPPKPLPDADRVVFYLENQGVYYWATAAIGEDPPVYGAWDIGGPWVEEEQCLSAFLTTAALFETVMGSSCAAGAAWVPTDALSVLVSRLREVPLGAWRWPSYPTRLYAGGEVLLVASPNDGAFSVWAAARRPDVPRPPGFDSIEWDSLNWGEAGV